MALTPGERYNITYRDGGTEREARAHYRGFGTADELARGDPPVVADEEGEGLHWFQLDGVQGYLTLERDDLIAYEVAEGYGG